MRRRRTRWLVALAVVVLGVAAFGIDRSVRGGVDRSAGTVRGAGDVRLAGRLFVPRSATKDAPAPAVLLAHGLGDDQDAMLRSARTLARAGYVVRTWTSRGTAPSTGTIGIAAPRGEVADVSALIDDLARRPQVRLDASGDPRVAVLGVSHGGGVALLAAAADDRIDATVPIFAWYDLPRSLEPNGVLKLRWASELFAAGSADERTGEPCGNLTAAVCAAWTRSARFEALTPQARSVLAMRSPSSIASSLRAPTLIVQGQMDSLFGFDEAIDLAAALRQQRVPARVEWLRAGHDLPIEGRRRDHLDEAILRWFDRYLRKRGGVEVGPRFTVELGSGRGYAHAPEMPPVTTIHPLDLAPVETDSWGRSRIVVPPAGLPAAATTLPGLGDVTGADFGFAEPEGQRAQFLSNPAAEGIDVIGAPRITLDVSASSAEQLLFVRLLDVAPDDRRIIPRGLVTPLRLTSLPPIDSRRGKRVTVTLPHVAWRVAPGHRFGIEIATTDAGYVAPTRPGVVEVSLADGVRGALELPTVEEPHRTSGTLDAGVDWRDLLTAAGLLVLLAIGIGIAIARSVTRRDARVQEPSLRNVPINVRNLTKRFGAGRAVVDGASFTVQAGSVVGLVGPNGAGKTTTIRMLLGLVHPNDGFMHVFGQRVRPGVPALARIGALVEGPGLLPHVSGRTHLERYWSATGRPRSDANIDEVLDAVGLTGDAHRVVGTWSHGMRQRLGIAQALLGTPDVVLLDEPTNGLDPAQINELRELIRSIAAAGRTVVLSSHLLGELEHVCTHVVLMVDGRVIEAGPIEDVVGTHATLEAAFLERVSAATTETGAAADA